jgi:hypothetical protein
MFSRASTYLLAVRRLLITLLLIVAGACGATDASAWLRPLAGYTPA